MKNNSENERMFDVVKPIILSWVAWAIVGALIEYDICCIITFVILWMTPVVFFESLQSNS